MCPWISVTILHAGFESREGGETVLQPPDGPPPGFDEAGKLLVAVTHVH